MNANWMDLHALAVTAAVAVCKWGDRERVAGFPIDEPIQPYISYAFYEIAPAPLS
jgi:hypothetical protein